MLNLDGIVFALAPLALILFALYWVVRAAVAAGIRSALPDSLPRDHRKRLEG